MVIKFSFQILFLTNIGIRKYIESGIYTRAECVKHEGLSVIKSTHKKTFNQIFLYCSLLLKRHCSLNKVIIQEKQCHQTDNGFNNLKFSYLFYIDSAISNVGSWAQGVMEIPEIIGTENKLLWVQSLGTIMPALLYKNRRWWL